MTEENAIALTEQLIRLGLGDRAGELFMNLNNPEKDFFIVWGSQIDNDLLQYFLRFERNAADYFRLKEYELTIRSIPVPALYISLNEELKVADGMTNAYYSGNEMAGDYEYCMAVEKKLKELHHADPDAAALFMFKYWPQSLYKEFIPDDSVFKQRYEVTLLVEGNGELTVTAAEAYQYIKQMQREHVIDDQLLHLANKEISHGNIYIAYNTITYFLDKPDMEFFKTKEEANEYADNNISEYDNYRAIRAESVDELLKQIPYGQQLELQLSNNKNLSIMNEKNFDYLSNQLKYTGFGEDLQQQLKEKLQNQEPQFTLSFQKDYGKDETAATLHFRKSDESDNYFFNRYNLMLKNDQHPDAIKQTFYISNKEDNITLKEAYNLMCGRAIHKELTNKEGEKYNAWQQLNFKETDAHGNFKLRPFNENYGFDLKDVLQNHPIKELLNETDSQRLIESLERGNRQSVTLTIQGKEQKVFIEAAPQFKSLNFYEASGQRIRTDKLYESNSQEQSVKQDDQKKSLKQNPGEDEGGPPNGKKKSNRKRQGIS